MKTSFASQLIKVLDCVSIDAFVRSCHSRIRTLLTHRNTPAIRTSRSMSRALNTNRLVPLREVKKTLLLGSSAKEPIILGDGNTTEHLLMSFISELASGKLDDAYIRIPQDGKLSAPFSTAAVRSHGSSDSIDAGVESELHGAGACMCYNTHLFARYPPTNLGLDAAGNLYVRTLRKRNEAVIDEDTNMQIQEEDTTDIDYRVKTLQTQTQFEGTTRHPTDTAGRGGFSREALYAQRSFAFTTLREAFTPQ